MSTVNKISLDGKVTNNAIFGIDLGTTNTAVAVYDASLVPMCLPIGHKGKNTLQSCVMWLGGNEFVVGEKAYESRYRPNVCYSVKRLMGSGQLVKLVSPSGEEKTFLPEEISAEILKECKRKVAELYAPLTRCVITVPAYFNQMQIKATSEAAKLAGLDCEHILKEPTSASYIYSLMGYVRNGAVLIYDLGGGTFDVTHMKFLMRSEVSKGMLTSLQKKYKVELPSENSGAHDYFCQVLGTYGDMRLGGDDIDRDLAQSVAVQSKSALSTEQFEKLVLACEQFKKQGSEAADVPIGEHMFHITKSQLNEAVDKTFDKTMALLEGTDLSNVTSIVLVGGSTKSERLRRNLELAFPNVEVSAVLNPDDTVALGAAAVAKSIANEAALAYQDVLPLSIGVLVDEEKVDFCIQRNTAMPYTTERTFYTMHDNQDKVQVMLFQGLKQNYRECTFIGEIRVEDVPKAKAGDVPVTLCFTLTAQGRLQVTSSVQGIEREQELIVENIFNVSQPEKPKYFDEFEEAFMPLLYENEKAMTLFEKRRASAPEERAAIEEELSCLL